MGRIKPAIEQEPILALLQRTFTAPIEDLTPLEGGQVAQTFSFTAGDQPYVLRFNPGSFDVTFQKELFIATHFASPRIPISPILKVGRLGDLSYAISRKMAGRRLLALSRAEYEQTRPSLVRRLHAIHRMEANASFGPDTIIFTADGAFILTIAGADEDAAGSGDLDITDSLTIRGNGAQKTIIDGAGTTLNDRIFHIDPAGVGLAVSFSFVTIQNGHADPAAGGGGILNGVCRAPNTPGCDPAANESRLTLDHVDVRANSVSGIAFASGGGIQNYGYLILTHSTIEANRATVSGGLENGLAAIAELDQVVISNNTGSLDTQGTPLGTGGGFTNADTATMTILRSRITLCAYNE